MKKVIYFGRISLHPNKETYGGGQRRTLQILDLLNKVFDDVEYVDMPKHSNWIKSGKVAKLRRKMPWGNNFIRYYFSIRNSCLDIMHENALKKIDVAIVEDPIYFIPLVEKLCKYNVPVIAVCHNLESLVDGQTSEINRLKLFSEEIKILKKCRLAITISNEDFFTLRHFKINAQFFPYYPPENVVSEMVKLRKLRQTTIKHNCIMLGSARNNPTERGMKTFINFWNKNNIKDKCDNELIIAGWDTETLLKHERLKGAKLFGSLPKSHMYEVLSNVRSFIIFQNNGTGAITRIPEMLIANIPIISNSLSARSYSHTNGVFEFHDLYINSFLNAMKRAHTIEKEIPIPTRPPENILVSEIRKTIAK